MKRITGSLVVCVGAGVFTAGALFREPPDRPAAVATSPAAPGGSGAVTYGNGSSGSNGAADAAPATIEIADFSFGDAAVARGAVVNLVNRDGAEHTVTADDGSFDVVIDGRTAGSLTAPSAPGTYAYFCAIHPQMHGVLVVR